MTIKEAERDNSHFTFFFSSKSATFWQKFLCCQIGISKTLPEVPDNIAPLLAETPSEYPTLYQLHLQTFLPGYDAVIEKEKEFTFQGTVTVTLFYPDQIQMNIHFEVFECTDKLVVNQKELNIKKVLLIEGDEKVRSNFPIDDKLELLTVSFQ